MNKAYKESINSISMTKVEFEKHTFYEGRIARARSNQESNCIGTALYLEPIPEGYNLAML